MFVINEHFVVLIILVNCLTSVYPHENEKKANLNDINEDAEELNLQSKENYANNKENDPSKFIIACIRDGCLRGYRKAQYDSFIGIPYGKPPVGNRRFTNPVPNDPYTENIRNATQLIKCIQKNIYSDKPVVVVGSEDCLYLNVHRPKGVRRNSNMPVMVHIHGGAFCIGTSGPSIFGPEYFMENGETIMVTMNYRLGVLGLLSTVDEYSPGNFGLKDQLLAMKWVRKNIRHFGGNTNSVTLIGASSGAFAVQMHMMSPASQGYFQRAILLSSTAISPLNYPTKDPLALAQRQAEILGVNDAQKMSNKDLVETLRKFDAADLVNSAIKLKFWSIHPKMVYRPIIEKDLPDAFITNDLRDIWKNGDFKHVPWIVCFIENDGSDISQSILQNDTSMAELTERFDELIPKFMDISNNNVEELEWTLGRIKDFYFNGTSDVGYNLGQNLTSFFNDYFYNLPLYCSIFQYLQYANPTVAPVDIYKFDFRGTLSNTKIIEPGYDYGVLHADDLIYLYRNYERFPHQLDPYTTAYKMMQILIKTYTHFAKYGVAKKWVHLKECHMEYNPQMKNSLPQFCEYQRFSRSNDNYVRVNAANMFHMDAMEFWRSTFEYAEKRSVLK